MTDRSPHGGGDEGALLGRRGFIGAGLAGAGTVLVGGATRSTPAPAQASPTPQAPTPGGAFAQMPVREQYPHLPAIPLDPAGTGDTLAKLEVRAAQVTQAKQGLSRPYTLGGKTRTAYEWLYGAGPHRASLEDASQFSMGWTTFPDVDREGRSSLPAWASSLTDADAATEQFWPTVAHYGTAYNLILPERVTRARARSLRSAFKAIWARDLQAAASAGNLYVIDLSRFEALQPQAANGTTRFTPATITLLTRHPRTGDLTPIAVLVSGHRGKGRRLFARADATDGAWLYALQAAKTSITVFGVWLGHVYHWHLVTAAMQMAMFNTLPTSHPVYELLAPQSKYLIGFDQALLALWSDIAPPTSLASGDELLQLADDYAAGRSFFDDDPKATLSQLGLRAKDFSDRSPWDRYPVVQRLLSVWGLVEQYVTSCVRASYATDAAVARDQDLQAWIANASAPGGGNVRGLPAMDGRAALVGVLTSLVYRVTIHGVARLGSTSNPALTFVANFPHCLQRTDIPHPRARLDAETLLTYLPNTETIGAALSFYFTFAFSTPYEPFIPLGGPGSDLLFPGGPGTRRNKALIELRRGLAGFIEDLQPEAPQRFQWPRNIET